MPRLQKTRAGAARSQLGAWPPWRPGDAEDAVAIVSPPRGPITGLPKPRLRVALAVLPLLGVVSSPALTEHELDIKHREVLAHDDSRKRS